jgi:hypothetical protein
MKHRIAVSVVLVSLAGCFTPPPLGSKDLPKSNPPKAAMIAHPPVVTADQVNESNAHAKAQALEAEVEVDLKQPETGTTKMPTP